MARHVLFLMHGMGDFSKGWSTPVQAQLRALYAKYDIAKALPFDDVFAFEEVVYNGRFEKLRKQWTSGAAAVIKELRKGGLPDNAATDLLRSEARAADDEFVRSHLLDVLLYRFVPEVAEEARALVAKRIQEVIFPKRGDPPRWSVIAHGLGTAVAHDSLHAMFTHTAGGRTLLGLTKAQAIVMIANVSRLLEQRSVDVYTSVVRPGLGDQGICEFYVNVWHEWDPLPRPKAFRPLHDWPDVATRLARPDRFVGAAINAFQHRNVHALDHYLADPGAHVPIFRALLPVPDAIPEVELARAVAAHEATTPFGQFEALQRALKELQLAEEASWKQVIAAFKRFTATVRKV